MFDNVVTHIADDRQLRDHLHDPEPDADVLRPPRHRPPRLAHELLRVQPNLDPVILQWAWVKLFFESSSANSS